MSDSWHCRARADDGGDTNCCLHDNGTDLVCCWCGDVYEPDIFGLHRLLTADHGENVPDHNRWRRKQRLGP